MSKKIEDLIDEDFDKLDKKQYEMQELGLNNYGDDSYYFKNPDEYEKDLKIANLEEKVLRLEEQLKNAVIPKFKVGQDVWFIDNNNNIQCFKIVKIEGLNFRYYDDIGFWVGEQDLFATKEEAEQKLKELKGV